YEVERAVRQLDAGGGEGVHVGHVLDHEAGPVPAPHQRGQSRGGRERRVEREQRVGALCAVLRGGVVQLRRGEAGEGVEAEGDQGLGLVGEGGHRGGGDGSSGRGRGEEGPVLDAARVGGIPSAVQGDQGLHRGVVGGGGAVAGGGVDRGPVHGELVGDQNPVDALTALDRLLVVGERAPGRGELL